jgi:imidazolonepropionase-like amidohydrolase
VVIAGERIDVVGPPGTAIPRDAEVVDASGHALLRG